MEKEIQKEELRMLNQRFRFRISYEKIKERNLTPKFSNESEKIMDDLKNGYNYLTKQLNGRGYRLKYLR